MHANSFLVTYVATYTKPYPITIEGIPKSSNKKDYRDQSPLPKLRNIRRMA